MTKLPYYLVALETICIVLLLGLLLLPKEVVSVIAGEYTLVKVERTK